MRIDESLFASESERIQARQALEAVQTVPEEEAALEQAAIVDGILRDVLARESGGSVLRAEDRREIEDSLRTLEERLIEEIKARKAGQQRDVNVLLAVLVLCVVGTFSVGVLAAIRGVGSPAAAGGAGLGLASGIVCSILTARILQNCREALERMDEKIVAVRFLRMALHTSWTTDVGGRLIDPALAMFAKHFAPSSTPLGVEDTRALLDTFKQQPSA
ncbi:hypothetical protein AB0B66_37350 [Catellatospora sp. NPDC049111]|uniref:hypothetical protein n=1 Tax=Catellatospora sp. NPDC049111 TaxID=3155271 RepID=UPI0033CC9D44